eukprot:2369-Ditylum_brightwellii.AAC.1
MIVEVATQAAKCCLLKIANTNRSKVFIIRNELPIAMIKPARSQSRRVFLQASNESKLDEDARTYPEVQSGSPAPRMAKYSHTVLSPMDEEI